MGEVEDVKANALTALVLLATIVLSLFVGTAAAQPDRRAVLICNSGPAAEIGWAAEHPRHCTILPPRASFSEGVNLAKLRWRHWGDRHARFRGISKGFHLPYLHLRVRGYAYRLRPDRCGSGLLLYTRVRYRLGGRTYAVKPQGCYGSD